MKKYNAWCSCGWHGTYKTEGLADGARRRHSCELWESRRATSRRYADRMRAIDRTPKECTHPQAQHQHGTNAAYVLDFCRCLPCAAAGSEYNRQLQRDTAYGRARMTDAGPVREHVQSLRASGMGLRTIAARSGVSHGALTKLIYGNTNEDGKQRPPSARVRTEVAEALLGVRADAGSLADGAVVDATGSRRRLQALATIGWSVRQVSIRSGIDRQALDKVLRGNCSTTARTARGIAEVYDRLWNQAPPREEWHEKAAYARTVNAAQAAGYAPPLAWDDETIDDPTAEPDTGTTERRGGRPGIDLDEWAHLVRCGESPERAAERCGTNVTAVARAAHRAGRRDLAQLAERAAAAGKRVAA